MDYRVNLWFFFIQIVNVILYSIIIGAVCVFVLRRLQSANSSLKKQWFILTILVFLILFVNFLLQGGWLK